MNFSDIIGKPISIHCFNQEYLSSFLKLCKKTIIFIFMKKN